jgi:hypothetical protein
MKNIAVIIVVGFFLFLGFSSRAFCASSGGHSSGGHSSGGYSSSGHSSSGHYSGGYSSSGHYSGGYYGGGYRGYYGGGYRGYYGWRGGPYWGWYGFGPWGYPYAYPSYYPYSYPSPVYSDAYAQPPVSVEPEQTSYWYFCQDAQAYYPYVQSCPGGWTRVVPTPPQLGKEGATP